MTQFEEFFDGNIFVINLARRPDRMAHFHNEMRQIGVSCFARFNAVDAGVDAGVNFNYGCTASHRAVLDLIVQRGLRRAMIFEDDATVREPFRGTFQLEFAAPARELPDDWDMFYLGGHYGEMPRQRVSPHLILMGAMKTTSSYGVTAKSARELRDLIAVGSADSIDNLYAEYNATKRCYISEPRFFVQYNNYSDLQKRQMNNTPCMEDQGHVERLYGPKRGTPLPPPPPPAPRLPMPPAPVVEIFPPRQKPVAAVEKPTGENPLPFDGFNKAWAGRKSKS